MSETISTIDPDKTGARDIDLALEPYGLPDDLTGDVLRRQLCGSGNQRPLSRRIYPHCRIEELDNYKPDSTLTGEDVRAALEEAGGNQPPTNRFCAQTGRLAML